MANMTITRRAIHAAFLELLNERTLSRITVRDITDRCGINRNTFYYHYQDVPALLEEICAEEVERIIREYPALNSLEECLDAGMRFAQENKRAIQHIYDSDNRSTYVNCLWRICEQTVRTYINTVFAGVPVTEQDKELIIRYHKCECFGLILDWIGNGMRDDVLQGMHRIIQLRRGSTEELIRRSAESAAAGSD